MTTSVESLRDRLVSQEAKLTKLRSRVKSAKETSAKPGTTSTISDIQRRYLSAVAQLETKEKELPKPIIKSNSDAVSSLASRWNKGMEGKKLEKTAVEIKADIDGAKKNFSAKDAPKVSKKPSVAERANEQKNDADPGPEQFIVEDGSEVPSWAKNQHKLVIRKENARNSVRDVDVQDLQGTVLQSAARDGSEAERAKVEVGGNVKAALAMWGKTAEEDAKALALKIEEDKRKAKAAEASRKEKEAQQKNKVMQAATAKFASMQLSDMRSEPNDELELLAFLERKIVLVEKEIREAEKELEQLEDSQ